MTAPFMPLYIADFQADTVHLNGVEAGAYLMLLMAMWRAGGTLDADEKKLARYAKVTPQQWERVRVNVLEFFDADEVDPGKITQRRLRSEISKYGVAVEKRAERASRGGKAKSLKSKETPLLEAGASSASEVLNSANQNQNQNHIEESISKEETLSSAGVREGVEPFSFQDFADLFPKQDGVNAAAQTWHRLIDDGVAAAEIMAGLRKWVPVWHARIADPKDSFELQHIRGANRWLTETGWLDRIEVLAGNAIAAGWSGPDAIREAILIELQERGEREDDAERFCRSYLDPAGWKPEPATIMAKTDYAVGKLKAIGRLRSYRITTATGEAA